MTTVHGVASWDTPARYIPAAAYALTAISAAMLQNYWLAIWAGVFFIIFCWPKREAFAAHGASRWTRLQSVTGSSPSVPERLTYAEYEPRLSHLLRTYVTIVLMGGFWFVRGSARSALIGAAIVLAGAVALWWHSRREDLEL